MKQKKISVILLFLMFFLSLFNFHFGFIDVSRASMVGNYYIVDFEGYTIGEKYFNETVGGFKWLQIEPVDNTSGLGVRDDGPVEGNSDYCLEKNDGGSDDAQVFFNISYPTTNLNYTVRIGTSNFEKFQFIQFFNASNGSQIFKLIIDDMSDGDAIKDIYVYDGDNVLKAYYIGISAFQWINISLNTSTNETNVKVIDVGLGTVFIDVWFHSSNFGYIDSVNFIWDRIANALLYCYLDDFMVFVPPDQPPIMDNFAVDTEPGANSGWDLDNNDVQVDFGFHDFNNDSVDLYFTFNKGSQARQPTTGDYDARILTASNQSNYDLDWTGGSWSDYEGEVYVRVRAWDGSNYSDDATPVLYVDYDYLDFGIDGTDPVSSVDSITPYRQTTSPFAVDVTASDVTSGVYYADLYYRYSTDNSSWGSYQQYGGSDPTAPYSWSFSAPNGQGYYEFCSRGTDNAGNLESIPGSADVNILYNTPPEIYDEYPENHSTIGYFQPNCYVRVVDDDYNNMDVYFYEKTTGSWVFADSVLGVSTQSYVDFDYNKADSIGQYYWKVSVNDGVENVSKVFWFNISGGECPYVTDIYPGDDAEIYSTSPTVSFVVHDGDSATVDYNISSNVSGSWSILDSGTVANETTVQYYFSQANSYNETYYWRINVSDENCTNTYNLSFRISLHCPFNLQVTNTETDSISLGWTKGTGTDNTLVLYKQGTGYPDNPYDPTAYTAYFGSGSSTVVGGLDNNTVYSFRAWGYKNGVYSSCYDQVQATTESEEGGEEGPHGFRVRNINTIDTLELAVGMGDTDWVHIRRSTDGYPSGMNDGDFVVNGTIDTFEDDELTAGELYYYRAFFSDDVYNSSANITNPNPPSDLDLVVKNTSNFTITWDKGNGNVDTTMVRCKNNTAPSNETDGIQVYNNTGTTTVHNTFYYPYVYRAWSYVEENGYYAFSSHADMDDVEGNIVVNAYNELTGNDLSSWNIIITSNTGGTQHTGFNKNNPYIIDASGFDSADYYTFKATKSEYYSGHYSFSENEIESVVNFPLDAYLTPISGVNDSDYKWYQIRVENQFNKPIEGIKVEFNHETNETTGNTSHIGSFFTDTYGEFQLFLISGDTYYLNISKDGYENRTWVRYIPSSGPNYNPYKTFILHLSPGEYENYTNPWDFITFTAEFSDTTSLDVAFSDSSGNTDNAYILVFENTSNTSFYNNYFSESSKSFTVPYDSDNNRPNQSKATYIIKLYIIGHPDWGDFSAIIIVPITGFGNQSISLDMDIASWLLLGGPDAGIGWVNFFIFGVLFFVFDLADKKRLGVIIATIGLIVIGISGFIGIPAIGMLQATLFAIYCLILGAFIEIARSKRRNLFG